VGADGDVSAFGDAKLAGSVVGGELAPVVAIGTLTGTDKLSPSGCPPGRR
jgi:hypothetical protein